MALPSEQLSSDSFYDFSVSSRISLCLFPSLFVLQLFPLTVTACFSLLVLLSFSGAVWYYHPQLNRVCAALSSAISQVFPLPFAISHSKNQIKS